MKNRKTNARVKSGCVAFGYKYVYDKYFQLIEMKSKFIAWFKISSKLLDIDEDFVIGILYMPPEKLWV